MKILNMIKNDIFKFSKMNELPHVVQNKHIHPFETSPTSMMMSSKNEVMFFYSDFQYISVYSIEPFAEVFRFFTSKSMSVTCTSVQYIDATDSFIITQFDQTPKIYQIVYVTKWRNNKKSDFTPQLPEAPANWEFKDPQQKTNVGFLIGQFKEDSNPVVEISGNSAMICTSSAALIWDFEEKPIFRCSILIPRFDRKPLFCFKGNTMSLAIADRIFLIRLENHDDFNSSQALPFTPGTKCFELGDKLDIDFGLTDEGANALFLVRSLPNHKWVAKTLFNTCLPGDILSIKALSEKSFIFLTKHAVILLSQRGDKFIPEQFADPNECHSIAINKDFVILYGEKIVRFVPNPERNEEHIDEGLITALDESRFFGLKKVCTNDEFCALLSCIDEKDDQKADVRILKFEDPISVGLAALKSPELKDRKAAIRLMGAAAPEFARAAFSIGQQMLQAKERAVEAVRYLIASFNVPGALSKEERSNVINSIKKLPQSSTARRDFLRFAKFVASEIDEDIIKMMGEDSPCVLPRKMTEAGKFDFSVDEKSGWEAELHTAILSSLKGDRTKAAQLFSKCANINNLKIVPREIIEKISIDLPSQILVVMGFTNLKCEQWTNTELEAARKHFLGDFDGSIKDVSQDIKSNSWHYSQWPSNPLLCEWAGELRAQFVAGCAVKLEVNSPDSLKWVSDSVKFAKEKNFGEGMKCLKSTASRLNYLRMFATNASDWVSILEQIQDENVREIAMHELQLLSPRIEFYDAIKKTTQQDIVDLSARLRQADNELLKALSLQ